MFQALPKTITFEDFLGWKPDAGCYELHDGVIVEMQLNLTAEQIFQGAITLISRL